MFLDRKVRALLAGNVIAKAIPFFMAPVLTRIFSPEQFGVFATILAIAAVSAVLITGRLELAIGIPKRIGSACQICFLGGIMSVVVYLILVVCCLLISSVTDLLDNSAIGFWGVQIGLLLSLLTAFYQLLYYLSLRTGIFSLISKSKVGQSSFTVFGQILFSGVYSWIALILGQFLGLLVGIFVLRRSLYLAIRETKRKRFLFFFLKRFKNFPIVLAPAHFIGSLGPYIPLLFIGLNFSGEVAGLLALVQRVIGVPLTVISSSIGDVFKQEASDAYRINGDCRAVFDKNARTLILLGFLPLSVAYFAAPKIFDILFGDDWAGSGEIARLLIPMYFLRFLSSPLSFMYIIAEKQRIDLFTQLSVVTIALLSFGVCNSPIQGLTFYSIGYSFIYFFNFFISRKFSRKN